MNERGIYRGRFAPSPTGPLHAGSLAAALASWLDARAHAGAWLIRIENVDSARCKAEWGQEQLQQLAAHGLHSDEAVIWQSARRAAYATALIELQAQGLVYACRCSRKKIADYWQVLGVDKARHGDVVYPGFCRDLGLSLGEEVALRLDVGKTLNSLPLWGRARVGAEGSMNASHAPIPSFPQRGKEQHADEANASPLLRHSRESGNPPAESPAALLQNLGDSGVDASKPSPQPSPSGRGGNAWIPAPRFRGGRLCAGMTGDSSVGAENLTWQDRTIGAQSQNICQTVGDFILRRADGCYSYQLAVVVDDAQQGISHVVRGLDLLDNTPRQILLQQALGLPTPQYLHTPLVLAADGQKLSKQNGAAALNSSSPAHCLVNLHAAALALGLPAAKAGAGQDLAAYLHSLLPLWAAAQGTP